MNQKKRKLKKHSNQGHRFLHNLQVNIKCISQNQILTLKYGRVKTYEISHRVLCE